MTYNHISYGVCCRVNPAIAQLPVTFQYLPIFQTELRLDGGVVVVGRTPQVELFPPLGSLTAPPHSVRSGQDRLPNMILITIRITVCHSVA